MTMRAPAEFQCLLIAGDIEHTSLLASDVNAIEKSLAEATHVKWFSIIESDGNIIQSPY